MGGPGWSRVKGLLECNRGPPRPRPRCSPPQAHLSHAILATTLHRHHKPSRHSTRLPKTYFYHPILLPLHPCKLFDRPHRIIAPTGPGRQEVGMLKAGHHWQPCGILYSPVHSSPPVIRQVLVRSHQSQFLPSHFQSPIHHRPIRHRESVICDHDG